MISKRLTLTSIYWLSLAIIQTCCCAYASAAGDPFKPYLKSAAVLKQMISETSSGDGLTSVTVKKMILYSRQQTNEVYAIMACPKQKGKYPALLMLHGGGGNAESMAHLALEYAAQGYVTMCFDMPGICNNSTTPNSTGAWKTKPGPLERPRFDIAGGLENCTLFDAGLAGIEVFNYLAAQQNVDQSKIGITGYSWGGYATTLLSGLLEKRVRAAYAVYGCGFYDKGSFWTKMITELPDSVRNPWLTYFDAGRRAKQIKAPYFLESPSNDTYFWPEAASNTIAAIPGWKNHVWSPNLNHKQGSSGKAMMKMYFDYYLKGLGDPFGRAQITSQLKQADGSEQVTIEVKLPKGVSADSVQLYYSKPTSAWQTRAWLSLKAKLNVQGIYSANIPADLAQSGVDYYAYVTDTRSVAVSSEIFSTKP